jgi:hypothetical protein
MTTNGFGGRDRLEDGDAAHEIFRLDLNTASGGSSNSVPALASSAMASGLVGGRRRRQDISEGTEENPCSKLSASQES